MTPWIVACQAPLSIEFSRQGYWNGLPFPTPGDLPNPGIEPISLVSLAGRFWDTHILVGVYLKCVVYSKLKQSINESLSVDGSAMFYIMSNMWCPLY